MPKLRYKSLVDRYAADIREGRLRPGTQLPTHRELAHREGLALVTATRVYAELEAMGLVSGETGRGTFVKEALPIGHGVDLLAWSSDTIDLGFNNPSVPGQSDLLRTALRQIAGAGDIEALLRYQPHGGRAHERAIMARHLDSRGLKASAADTLIGSGAQHGLTVSAMALFEPGDVIAADAVTYPGFKLAAEACRLELVPVPVPAAGRGPDLDALAQLCKRRRVRAFYTMPTLHNPLGWVMAAQRRRELVAIARRYGLLLIEDGAYAFLDDRAPPPLAALAPECTIYVSGLSKSAATGLRVGAVHAPPESIARIERAIRATTWHTPALMTGIACRWIVDGTVAMLEAGKRRDARARQQIVTETLAHLKPVRHPASYFVWLPMPEEVRADVVGKALMRARARVHRAPLRDVEAGSACAAAGARVGRHGHAAAIAEDGGRRRRQVCVLERRWHGVCSGPRTGATRRQPDGGLEMEKQSKRSTASTEPRNPGVRTDKQQVKSRSADPGQSSYGGFKNEDTRRQHQTDAKGGNGKS